MRELQKVAIAELIARLDAALESAGYAPRDSLSPPASDAELETLARYLGTELPAEFVELYKLQNGESHSGAAFLFGETSGEVLPVAEIIQFHKEEYSYAQSQGGLEVENGWYTATGPVKPYMWAQLWVPFMLRDVLWLVDLSPAPNGIVGQILRQSPEDCTLEVVASSIRELLELQIDGICSGGRSIEDKLYG